VQRVALRLDEDLDDDVDRNVVRRRTGRQRQHEGGGNASTAEKGSAHRQDVRSILTRENRVQGASASSTRGKPRRPGKEMPQARGGGAPRGVSNAEAGQRVGSRLREMPQARGGGAPRVVIKERHYGRENTGLESSRDAGSGIRVRAGVRALVRADG